MSAIFVYKKYVFTNYFFQVRDHSGATPLHIASANGYLSVVEFLLDHHASTEVRDNIYSFSRFFLLKKY